ncbi:MAG: universal stress protein [Solirubrobacterales bacterium]
MTAAGGEEIEMTETEEATRRQKPALPLSERTILVGSDGSEGARDALELARVLGKIQDVRTLETHVTGTASPGRKLVEYAREVGARTLVVGSPHRGRVGRALLGSVAEHVLHHAPCEVIVAPRGYTSERHEPFTKIAVAVDGTPESEPALRRAEALARLAGATIEVLVSEDPVVAGVEAEFPPAGARAGGDVLEQALASVDPALAPTGKRLDPGWRQIARTIAATIAAACDADAGLLVAGSRRPLDRFLLGSVTRQLVDVSPCPLLVVPQPE